MTRRQIPRPPGSWASRITWYRKRLGLTQAQAGLLLDRSGLTVQRWETGAEKYAPDKITRAGVLAIFREHLRLKKGGGA